MPALRLFAAFALLAFLHSSGEGALLTDTATFGPLAAGSPSFTIALDKFDPSLGTLTSVTLTLDGVTCGNTLSFDNEARESGTVHLEIGISISASTDFGLAPLIEVNPTYRGSGSVSRDRRGDGAGDFMGSDSYRISGGGSDSDFSKLTAPSALAAFTGQSAEQSFLVTIGNSVFSQASTCGIFGPTTVCAGSFSGAVKVAYTYLLVPVPEAGTAFWGAGIALVVGLRRSRLRRA